MQSIDANFLLGEIPNDKIGAMGNPANDIIINSLSGSLKFEINPIDGLIELNQVQRVVVGIQVQVDIDYL